MTLPLADLHVGLLASSASRAGGGVFEALVRQVELIRTLGGKVTVFALRDAFSEVDAGRFGEADVIHADVYGLRQFGYAPGLAKALIGADLDLLHLHGIWMYPSRAATVWARRTGRQYLISPHGMLDPTTISRRAWKKWIGRKLWENQSWCCASAFHALTATELANIEAITGRVDTVVIPNAAPPSGPDPEGPREPHIVSIGRIHAIKNLAALVDGWALAARPPGARLTIVGWGDEAEVNSLSAQVAAVGPSVRYVGPLFGEDKLAMLNDARFTALVSHSEAMPMAVLEGWALGVPAIMSAACNLPEGFAAGAAIEAGPTPASIARALEQALNCDAQQWQTMSDAARDLAATTFSLENVAQQWIATYRGLARDERGVAG